MSARLMEFGGLGPLLGVQPPEPGERTVELNLEKIDLLKEQFYPFMAGAAEILKSRGIEDGSPLLKVLDKNYQDGGEVEISGQHGGNFVLISEKVGSQGRAILWFQGDQSFLVTQTYEDPDGLCGYDFKLDIPFDQRDIKIHFRGNE